MAKETRATQRKRTEAHLAAFREANPSADARDPGYIRGLCEAAARSATEAYWQERANEGTGDAAEDATAHPRPQVVARTPQADDPVAPAVTKWQTMARLNGWRTAITYARGNRMTRKGITKEPVHSTALRMAHPSGARAAIVWYAKVDAEKLSWGHQGAWLLTPGQTPVPGLLDDLQAHLERASLARGDKEAAA